MEIYLTSSPFAGHENPEESHTDSSGRALSEKNGFAGRIRKSAAGCRNGLFVASDPDAPSFMDQFAQDVWTGMEKSGINLQNKRVLDRRNAAAAARLVTESDFIVLAGGHTPTQNRFFREIGLKQLLEDRGQLPGPFVIMGISAGSMNAAELVYAMPEEEGESLDPSYERFLPGLGLTDAMIVPHYQRIKDGILDGKRLFEEIGAPDSMGRTIYLLNDGSYLYIRRNFMPAAPGKGMLKASMNSVMGNGQGEQSCFYGELHIMKDGKIRKIAEDGKATAIIS